MAVLLQGCLIAQQDERTGKTMETWMIVWAIVLATLIMIGFGAFRKWFKKIGSGSPFFSGKTLQTSALEGILKIG
mgnify:CR=1 FL=1